MNIVMSLLECVVTSLIVHKCLVTGALMLSGSKFTCTCITLSSGPVPCDACRTEGIYEEDLSILNFTEVSALYLHVWVFFNRLPEQCKDDFDSFIAD